MPGLQVQKPYLPGPEIRDPRTGKTFKSTFWRDGYFYDTLLVGSRTAPTLIAADARVDFLRNVQTKGLHMTNADEDRKIPNGWVMKVERLGLVFSHYWGATQIAEADIKLVHDNSCMNLRVDRDEIKVDKPIFWQGGVGLVGQSAGVGDFFLSVGVPSPQAIPKLKEPLYLANTDKNSNSLEAWLSFPLSTFTDGGALGAGGNAPVRPTIAGVVAVTLVMHGLIGTKGIVGTA